MRLIDADALRKHFEVPHELKCGIQAGMDEYALKCIDEQPTIAASPWHRVEEELPKYGQDVLAARLYGADSDGWAYEIVIAHIRDIRDSVYWNATNVTHWMPLPEPPKEDV